MEICIGSYKDTSYMLKLIDDLVYINGQVQPIKYITEDMLKEFDEQIQALPYTQEHPGYEALLASKRAQFIIQFLLSHAVGEECIDLLTSILDQQHSIVHHFLDDECDCENPHA